MLTESCLKKYLSQPCDGNEFMRMNSEPHRNLKHSVPGNYSSRDIAVKISRAVDFNCLGFYDFFAKDVDGQKVPLELVTVFIYCAACPCLLDTALAICSTGSCNEHLKFEVRVDPRLRVDCCSSITSGVERLKSLQAAIDDSTREFGHAYMKNVDFFWIDQIVFAAEDEDANCLNQVDSRASYRLLLNHYNTAYTNSNMDNTVTFILGDATYLVPIMDAVDCDFNPRVPTVGQIWQVYADNSKLSGWHWIRKPWQRYYPFKRSLEAAMRALTDDARDKR